MPRTARTAGYPTLLGSSTPLAIYRDGQIVATVANGDAAFIWLLTHQGQSVDYALRYGYTLRPTWDGCNADCPGWETQEASSYAHNHDLI